MFAMHRLTVVFLLVATAYGIVEQKAVPNNAAEKLISYGDWKSRISEGLKNILKEKQDVLVSIVLDVLQGSNKTWDEQLVKLFDGRSKQLLQDFIDTAQGEKEGTVSGFLKENFSDILLEILKALGVKGDSWLDILANLLESAVAKLLAAYSDKLSEEEAGALVAVFSGFVRNVVKLAKNPKEAASELFIYVKNEIGSFLKTLGIAGLARIHEKIKLAAQEANKKMVRFSRDWFIAYILRKGRW
ncbi:hypothetical protein AAHC03_09993 [Spirometra sp. Aus1]